MTLDKRPNTLRTVSWPFNREFCELREGLDSGKFKRLVTQTHGPKFRALQKVRPSQVKYSLL